MEWTHGTVRLGVVFAQDGGGAAAAFDRADNVTVRILGDGQTLFSGSVGVTPAGGPLQLDLEVELPEGAVSARIDVEVRLGGQPLFQGGADAMLAPGEETRVTLTLSPVAAGLALMEPPEFTRYGQEALLEGAVLFATGDEVPDAEVSWVSLDPTVVRIEGGGATPFRAVAVADGSTSLRGSFGSLAATVPARVAAVVASVEVLPESALLIPGEALDLTAVLRDAGGATIPGRTPSWTSSDEAVATVSSTGRVTARGPGTADISATRDGVTGTATVTVRRPGPDVTTLAPTDVGASVATLRALVDPRGLETTVVFRWGTDPGLAGATETVPIRVDGAAPATEVSRELGGLPDNTTFYVEAVASNAEGQAAGGVVSFTTPDLPAAPSGLEGEFTSSGVRLRWQDNSANETRFEIERERVSSGPTFSPGTASGPARVFEPLGETPIDQTLYDDVAPPIGELRYRVRACNAAGCSAWTPPLTWFWGLPPLVATLAPTEVTLEEALLRALANPLNAPTEVWWEIDFDPGFFEPSTLPESPLDAGRGNVDVLLETLADFLQPGATYYVRAVAANPWGVTVGTIVSFDTPSGG